MINKEMRKGKDKRRDGKRSKETKGEPRDRNG